MKTVILALAAALLAPVAAPVAANTDVTVSQTVRIGDLDLTTRAGVAELDRRVARAARRICDFRGVKTAWEVRAAGACRDAAIAAANVKREAAVAAARAQNQVAALR